MSHPIIEINGLGKQYRLGQIGVTTLRDSIDRSWRKLTGKKIAEDENKSTGTFWALRDVSFSVERGEVVGIIGRNGAGKSTLLKLLSRITEPTTGEARLRGRVASLLEVGTGFHPELTAKENVYLNGAILGMTRAEVTRKLDEIIAFAGVEKFTDTPVKRFSSGMYVRLAFAVAAHLEPEILIVDEVLAVGDADFQKKALGKMSQVGAEAGRTVLFVSHQMGAIAKICKRTLHFANGTIKEDGETQKVISNYLGMTQQNAGAVYLADLKTSSNKNIFISRCEMCDDNLNQKDIFKTTEKNNLRIEICCKEFLPGTQLGLALLDRHGRKIFTKHLRLQKNSGNKTSSYIFSVKFNFLAPGSFSWIVALMIPGYQLFDSQENICSFTIKDDGTEFAAYEGRDYGCILLDEKDFSFSQI